MVEKDLEEDNFEFGDDNLGMFRGRVKARKFDRLLDTLPQHVQDEYKEANPIQT